MKYNQTSNTYQAIYSSLNTTFGDGSVIQSYNNRVIVYSINNNNVFVEVYVESNSGIVQISSQSFTFSATPSVSISSELTKLLIYGVNGTALSTYLFFINYDQLSIQKLTYPTGTVVDPARYLAAVEENWLYIRQLNSSLSNAGDNLEIAY